MVPPVDHRLPVRLLSFDGFEQGELDAVGTQRADGLRRRTTQRIRAGALTRRLPRLARLSPVTLEQDFR